MELDGDGRDGRPLFLQQSFFLHSSLAIQAVPISLLDLFFC
jgi:hypothetical protein